MRQRIATTNYHMGGKHLPRLSTWGWTIVEESLAEGPKRRRFKRVKSDWGIPKGSKDDVLIWEEWLSRGCR